MLKTIFVNTLKFLFAAALIGWLLQSGKLDFKLLAKLKETPFSVLTAAILYIINFWFISFRWRSILRARSSVDIPMNGMMKITWIGQFFSSVLPGSVSGDLIKILYVQKFDSTLSKRFLFASILIDRAMGLSGLIILVGCSSLFFSGHILGTAPSMKPLLDINYLLTATVVLAFIIFFFFDAPIRKLLSVLQKTMLPGLWEKIILLWDDLVSIKSQLLKACMLSIVVQFIGVVTFWALIRPLVSGHMDFIQALVFIPLGLMTLALPVAPSGLGVGHAIFQKLFEFCGVQNGASLFNLYFVVTLAVNVFGVFPYLLSKGKTSETVTEA